jgi:hypothetical protein
VALVGHARPVGQSFAAHRMARRGASLLRGRYSAEAVAARLEQALSGWLAVS